MGYRRDQVESPVELQAGELQAGELQELRSAHRAAARALGALERVLPTLPTIAAPSSQAIRLTKAEDDTQTDADVHPVCSVGATGSAPVATFPTTELRDAFYDNVKGGHEDEDHATPTTLAASSKCDALRHVDGLYAFLRRS